MPDDDADHQEPRRSPIRPRRVTWPGVLVGLGVAAAAGAALLQVDDVRDALAGDGPARSWPGDRSYTLRQVLMDERDAAANRGDLLTAALAEARLSQEALRRVEAVQTAWMNVRNDDTKLWGEKPSDDVDWTYRNTVADFFGFMIQATLAVRPGDVDRLAETLAAERALDDADGLTVDANAQTGQSLGSDREEQLFGTSEYAKDGLLGVVEKHGLTPGGLPVGGRLREITIALMGGSLERARAGPVSGQRSEEVGNTLQVCNRLAYAFADVDPVFAGACSDYAVGVTEAVLFEMLPANGGLPAREFDFDTGEVVSGEVWFRDHGNEFFPGLAESYARAVDLSDEPVWAERADRWAPVLADLYEAVFESGIGEDGLMVNRIDPETREIVDARPSDNWGYVLEGVLLFAEAARRHGAVDASRLAALERGVDEVAAAVGSKYGVAWEAGVDGYYDSIESALYMMHHRPQARTSLATWVDDQVTACYEAQGNQGFAGGTYLDGNFIRTTLMYADWKRGGFRVEPWRADVGVGLAERDGRAVLVVTANEPYEGRLIAAEARWQAHMNLPWDWPRLNSWPEWIAGQGDARVVSADGVAAPATIAAMRGEGIPISLAGGGRVVIEFEVADAAVARSGQSFQ